MRDIGMGMLANWPPQRCYKTMRLTIYGITTILGHANMYLAICEKTRQSMIVDFSDRNPARWGRVLSEFRADVRTIAQTHGACSRDLGLSTLKNLSFFHGKVKIYGSKKEADLKDEVDEDLSDEVVLNVGDLRFECLHIPGPSAGHFAFFEPSEGVAFTGDLISRGGQMTRVVTDPVAMRSSLTKIIHKIPETTLLFPGHYGLTTMGAERRLNPDLMGVKGPPLRVPRDVQESSDSNVVNRKVRRWVL